MTEVDVLSLLAERRETATERAETATKHGLLRRRRSVTGWTVRLYRPAVENSLGHIMPDKTWSKDQVRGWREAYDSLEAKVRPSEYGLFLSLSGTLWAIDDDGYLSPLHS